MPKGPVGGPRPFAGSVLSINSEFNGSPRGVGRNEKMKNDLQTHLRNKFKGTKHSRSNMSVDYVETYPYSSSIGENGGYEVEVQMKPDGLMDLAVIEEVQKFIKGLQNGNNLYTTAVIAL